MINTTASGPPHAHWRSLLLLAGAAMTGAGVSLWAMRAGPAAPPPPLISLEKMGQLVSIRVAYANVIEFTQKRTLDIPWSQWELSLGGTSVLLVAKGDCLVATDLSAATYQLVDAKLHALDILLPQPMALQARINHESKATGGSYFYSVTETGLEPILPDSGNRATAIDRALAVAQTDLQRACNEPQVIAAARENAQRVLSTTFESTGWKPRLIWKASRTG